MTPRHAWAAVAIMLVIVFGCGAPLLTPVGAKGYEDKVLRSADGSLSAVRVTALLCLTEQQGQTWSTYQDVMLTDAREAVATSQHNLSTVEVPDAASVRLRDEVTPLLARASAAVGDAGLALSGGDPAKIAAARAELDAIGEDLDRFVEEHE
jgi:hypothetical protein